MDPGDRAGVVAVAIVVLGVCAAIWIIGHFTSRDAVAKRDSTVSAIERCVELDDELAQLACVYEALDS